MAILSGNSRFDGIAYSRAAETLRRHGGFFLFTLITIVYYIETVQV